MLLTYRRDFDVCVVRVVCYIYACCMTMTYFLVYNFSIYEFADLDTVLTHLEGKWTRGLSVLHSLDPFGRLYALTSKRLKRKGARTKV
ncbi:hypothetical protein KC325_g175 [Hortaea werneckii]|nr:hypothetical protein KC325_g175 [Hortaea werneckii]